MDQSNLSSIIDNGTIHFVNRSERISALTWENHPVFKGVYLRVQAINQLTKGQVIAVDGKTLRRSHDRSNAKSAIHMISAWACANGLVLGQIKTEEKSKICMMM